MDNKSYYIFGTAFLIFIIAIFLYLSSISSMNRYVQQVNHTQDVILAFEKLSSEIKSAQMMPSELGKHHKTALMVLYRKDIENIPSDIRRLRSIVSDNIRQQKRVDALNEVYSNHIQWMLTNYITDSIPPHELNNHFKNIMVTQRLIDSGIEEERKLLAERKEEYVYSSWKTNFLMALFVIVSTFLIIGTAVSNFLEIKKRQGVELFLESVLNTSQNGIVTYEAIRIKKEVIDFKALFANEAAEKQIGIKASSTLGQSFLAISPGGAKNAVLKRYIRILETGRKDEFETTTVRHNVTRCYKVILAKLNDGFTATFHDITELKNYQKELQQKVELLEATNQELEQFAYVASHDLQEPLRKIKTYAGLIDERFHEPSAAFARVYLKKVIQSADRMSILIGDLLNMSHLTKDKQSFVETDLNRTLKNILVDLELTINEKRAIINYNDLPVIESIPLQMNQLFYNLINNALKFSGEDASPEITISETLATGDELRHFNLDDKHIYHKISFHDNGIGFDPQYAEKIFIIFQRLNSRVEYSGSGIGLALCRKIVVNHHGAIYAESSIGTGACFHCLLPARQPNYETANV